MSDKREKRASKTEWKDIWLQNVQGPEGNQKHRPSDKGQKNVLAAVLK